MPPYTFAESRKHKISPDLRQLILSGNGAARVKVIVQSKSGSNPGLLGGLLNTVGGLLVGVLANLNIRIVDVEANNVEVLAADPDVSYISLDNTVRSSGHVTNTTGTQQVRAQKSLLGLNSTLDGSGVTIAVLDSGIDKTNHSQPPARSNSAKTSLAKTAQTIHGVTAHTSPQSQQATAQRPAALTKASRRRRVSSTCAY